MSSHDLLRMLLDTEADDASWTFPLIERWTDLVQAHCPRGGRILEPMCGLGRQSRTLARRIGARVIGFDTDKLIVDAANRLFGGATFRCNHLDLSDLPNIDERFDVVLFGYEAINAFPPIKWPAIIAWAQSLANSPGALIFDFQETLRIRPLSLTSQRLALQIRLPGSIITVELALDHLALNATCRYVGALGFLEALTARNGLHPVLKVKPFSDMKTTKDELRDMFTLVVVSK